MDRDEYFGRKENAVGPEPKESALRAESAATLTLTEIEKQTGISYVTLIRYAQQYRDRLPSSGEGNKRRYYPAAIEEFHKIRAEIAARRTGGQEAISKNTTGKSNRRGRKKTRPRSKTTAAIPPKIARAVRPAVEKSTAVAGIETGASSPSVSDLDRMARSYQLKIQRKALDGVLAFVTEWRARINSEIEEFEK